MMSILRPWMMLTVVLLVLLSCQETCGKAPVTMPEYPGDDAPPHVRGEFFLRKFKEEMRKRYPPLRRDIMDAEAPAADRVEIAERTRSRSLGEKSFTFDDGSNF